jgi:hypothetical protein
MRAEVSVLWLGQPAPFSAAEEPSLTGSPCCANCRVLSGIGDDAEAIRAVGVHGLRMGKRNSQRTGQGEGEVLRGSEMSRKKRGRAKGRIGRIAPRCQV